jgi:hypothetical protein
MNGARLTSDCLPGVVAVDKIHCRECRRRQRQNLFAAHSVSAAILKNVLNRENNMSKLFLICCAVLICLALNTRLRADESSRQTVIYDGIETMVTAPPAAFAPANAADLWVTLADLTRATKFVLKPQGICRDQLCFPIPKGRREAFLRKERAVTWFNLSEFARLVRQPVAHDGEYSIWYFGPRADEQNSYIGSLTAPDFTLPDVNGKKHSLSDFRGKKVLLLTWASW